MNRHMQQALSLMMTLLLFCTLLPAHAAEEHYAWDCPNGDRTGITSNFCGGCGHPAPWKEPKESPKPSNKPENELFSNGKMKREYILDNEGRIHRINTYNRYGYITQYQINEAYDADGRNIRYTIYHPNLTGKYSEYHFTAEYDSNGRLWRSSYTYADGSNGGATEYERDNLGRVTKLISYDEKNKIRSINDNYDYDGDGNTIFYQSFDADQKATSTTRLEYKDNVLVYSQTIYTNGEVSEYWYDSVYGDTLSTRSVKGTEVRTGTWTYLDNEYRRESITTGGDNYYHWLTQYSTHEKEQKSTSYDESGAIDYIRIYQYDDQDRLKGSVSTGYDDQGRINYAFYSNELSQYTKYESYTDGIMNYYELYDYDRQDRKVKETRYSAAGELDRYTVYEYDSKDREIKETRYSGAGELGGYKVYEYDSNGRVAKMTEYYPSGVIETLWKYRYLLDGTRQYKATHYREDGSYWFGGDEWK